jgi:hypothetical protein
MHSYGMPVAHQQTISTERCIPMGCCLSRKQNIFYRAMQTNDLQGASMKTHSIKNAHSNAKCCKFVQPRIPSGILRSVEENVYSNVKYCKFVQSGIPLGMLRSVENVRTSPFLHSVGMQPINNK